METVVKKHDEALRRQGHPRDWNPNVEGMGVKTYQVPVDKKVQGLKKYKGIPRKYFPPHPELFNKKLNETQQYYQFGQLCRGETLRSPGMDKNLQCHYLHHHDPYLRLGPFKVEVMNRKPFVAVLHDILYEKEMEAFIEEATPKLVKSTTMDKGDSGKRISQQVWLEEFGKEKVGTKVSDRIALLTRLQPHQMDFNEPFQVANYGMGGAYYSHLDYVGGDLDLKRLAKESKERGWPDYAVYGDRMATFMAYMSDVEVGGATVFPNMGISVWPKKGDAVLWYNVDRNGYPDRFAWHGGCPVIVGSKWILNKWIRQKQQMIKFPCSLENHEHKLYLPLDNEFCPKNKTIC